MRHVKWLDISNCGISEEFFSSLPSYCPKLRTLLCTENGDKAGNGFTNWERVTALTWTNLRHLSITYRPELRQERFYRFLSSYSTLSVVILDLATSTAICHYGFSNSGVMLFPTPNALLKTLGPYWHYNDPGQWRRDFDTWFGGRVSIFQVLYFLVQQVSQCTYHLLLTTLFNVIYL